MNDVDMELKKKILGKRLQVPALLNSIRSVQRHREREKQSLESDFSQKYSDICQKIILSFEYSEVNVSIYPNALRFLGHDEYE